MTYSNPARLTTRRSPDVLLAVPVLVVLAVITVVLGHQVLASWSSTAGAVPDRVTVFDDGLPALANLDPALLDALREAADDAADDGVAFHLTSGWRSRAHQERRLRDAVAEYGSEQEAARWVATADPSPHVSGDAADIGPAEATAWLSEHGSGYGLCQIYGNEPWHFELRPEALDHGCPPTYVDPTHDPLMQQ